MAYLFQKVQEVSYIQFYVNYNSTIKSIYCEGIYHGFQKPNNANDFLEDFVNETTKIINDSFKFQGQVCFVTIKGFVCDVPAKKYYIYKGSFRLYDLFQLSYRRKFCKWRLLPSIKCKSELMLIFGESCKRSTILEHLELT